MKIHPQTEMINFIKYRFNLDDDKANEEVTILKIRKGIEFKGTNLWTLIFATIIASIGLNVNSTAVIIGAMLISPIMGPIMGIGMGAGIFDFNLIKNAIKNLLIATLIGLIASTIYFLLTPLNQAQSELLSRTSPTIWDVLIALFGGLAGIVASSRKKYNNVIPGVAIATALMPPLCTAGYGLATGQWGFFFGAFYLYIINSVFISIGTFLIVRFLKFHSVAFVDPNRARTVKRWVGIIAILTIIPSVFLAYLFVKDEIFNQNANRLLNDEVLSSNYTVLYKKINPDTKEITINIFSDKNVDSLKQILEIKKIHYNLQNTKITINNNKTKDKVENLTELKEGIIENMFAKQEELIQQKNNEIESFKITNENQIRFDAKKEEAIDEFYALYGKPKELVIERSILYDTDSLRDTILLVYINTKNRGLPKNTNQIDEWLKTKFHLNRTKIIFQTSDN